MAEAPTAKGLSAEQKLIYDKLKQHLNEFFADALAKSNGTFFSFYDLLLNGVYVIFISKFI